MPAVGIPKLGGFPQVCPGCAACGCLWLNDSEEVRLDKHAMDADTAEALAGVVRLLRQAALRAWVATDRAGARPPGQLFAFGVDLAAEQARDLVPDVIDIDGPVPAVAVLWHAGSGGSTRNYSNDSVGRWLGFDASLGSRQGAAPGPDSHCGSDSSDLPSRTLARRWLTT
jgi:hypothetical protein